MPYLNAIWVIKILIFHNKFIKRYMVSNLHLEPKFMFFLLSTFQWCLTKFWWWLGFRAHHEHNLELKQWVPAMFSYLQWKKPHFYLYSILGFHLIFILYILLPKILKSIILFHIVSNFCILKYRCTGYLF